MSQRKYNEDSEEWLHILLKLMLNILKNYTNLKIYLKEWELGRLNNLLPKKYILFIRNFKQALNQGLAFTKAHKIIKFNEEALLKSYIWQNSNWTRTQNHLVHKRTLNHLAKWLSVRLRTKWFWVQAQLQSLKL